MLTFNSPKAFRTIMELVGFLMEDVQVEVGPMGLSLSAMDSSHVAIMSVVLPPSAFSSFKVKEATSVGLNVQDVLKVLRRGKPDDELEMSIIENVIEFKMSGKRAKRRFSLKSRDGGALRPEEESIAQGFKAQMLQRLPARIAIEASMLEEIVKDSLVMSDVLNVEIRGLEKVISFSAIDESGAGDLEIELEFGALLDADFPGEVLTSMYSLGFLESMVRVGQICPDVDVRFGEQSPMLVIGKVEGGGEIVYLLAPRVIEEPNKDEEGDFNKEQLESALEDDYVVEGDEE